MSSGIGCLGPGGEERKGRGIGGRRSGNDEDGGSAKASFIRTRILFSHVRLAWLGARSSLIHIRTGSTGARSPLIR